MFMRLFERYAYSLMRIVTGFLFFCHGSQKLLNVPSAGFDLPTWLKYSAGPFEFFCGLLVMIGLGTRWAAFIASGQMAVAYWYAHGTKALLPLMNRGELAAFYCFVFLFISAAGPGIWSFDNLLGKRKSLKV